MAGRNPNFSDREQLNIAEELRVSKSTVQCVVKLGDERGGGVRDVPRLGRPTKLTKAKRKRVQEVVDENPRLPLRKITCGCGW